MEKEAMVVNGTIASRSPALHLKQLQNGLSTAHCPGIPSVRYYDDRDQEVCYGEFKEVDQMQDSADKLKVQREALQSLKHQFQVNRRQVGELQAELADLRRENKLLHQAKVELDLIVPERQRLQYEVATLREEKQYYEQKLKAIAEQNLEEQLHQRNQEIALLRNTVSLLRIDNQKLEKTISLQKIQINDHERAANFELASIKIHLKSAEKQGAKLKAENDALRKRVELLENTIQDLSNRGGEAKIQGLKQELQKIRKELDNKEEMILTLQEELNRKTVEHHAQITKISSEMERVLIQNNKLRAQNENHRLSLEECRSKIAEVTVDNENLRKENENLNKTLRRLAVEIEQLKANSGNSEGLLRLLKEENESLKGKLQRINEWKVVDRQQRYDIQSLRYDARVEKEKEIRRIDQLISQIRGISQEQKCFPQ